MKVLFTGFTSRTVGSDRNVYDYMSNVFVLQRALELAGHEVTARPVSLLEDPCIEDDFDCAVVGIAAMQGLSSRFKLGGLWALERFGKRAGIFPSDGKNIYTFPSSVLTCLEGVHYDKVQKKHLDPIDYMLGALQQEKNNINDAEFGGLNQDGHPLRDVWKSVLRRLPHVPMKAKCDWPVLIPTHSWGNPTVYQRHFGAPVTTWDPTNIAIPMQFPAGSLAPDGRLVHCHTALQHERIRRWIVSSLQDQSGWLKKMKCKWPIAEIGNKRKARDGEGEGYIPELELVHNVYTKSWGHLAFGYPLADGGWWRMRYVHAALAGIVTCCDAADQVKMPDGYKFTRAQIELMTDEGLTRTALRQHEDLKAASTSADEAISRVNSFVEALARGEDR